jgi:hypothetical protein
MSQRKTINAALASFSEFIRTSLWIGVIATFIGAFLYGSNSSSGDFPAMIWGIVLIYFGSGLFGLSIVGMFLRQTARVIVEGLGGNLVEVASALPGNSTQNSDGSERVPGLWKLSGPQKVIWEEKGRPDLGSWDGNLKTFNSWIESQ